MSSRRLVQACFALFAVTTVLLVFGSTVRVHGAGLACPDWPLCFGVVVPELDFQVFLEWGHRALAGGVSLGFLALGAAARAAGWFRSVRGWSMLYGVAAAALATQIVLGGLTVLELLAEWTVASHLVTGNTFAALLLALAHTAREADAPRARGALAASQRAMAMLLMVLVPMQLAMGGLVAGSQAGLACGATWPSCTGAPTLQGWFPTMSGLVGLQVQHRLLAYTLLVVAWANLWVQRRGSLAEVSRLVALLVTAQATLGIANVLWQLPVEVTLAHSAGAALTFQATVWQLAESVASPRREAASVASLRTAGGAA
jgi:cytochrome c oxidase assembly protein subunit 15